jgi:hypothetical protein
MTAEQLHDLTVKDLARLAKKHGLAGWHSMAKDQLVKALLNATRRKEARKSASRKNAVRRPSGNSRPRRLAAPNAKSKRDERPRQTSAARKKPKAASPKLRAVQERQNRFKDLSSAKPGSNGRVKDRLVLMVRDCYWLHVYWELSRRSIDRAQAALGQEWHAARPIIRLLHVASNGGTSTAEAVARDIPIHGGVNNWYIDVKDPPKRYQVEIGYFTATGRFFAVCRSNAVSTPRPGSADSIDKNWLAVAENYEKVYAQSGGASFRGADPELTSLFEERLHRPMTSGTFKPYGVNGSPHERDFSFKVDADLIVYGATQPGSRVTLHGQPVELRPDGTFTVRYSLPNCRQVIPAVACSCDGVEQRTIVLAVERNTKAMEPVTRDIHEM